MGPDNYDTDPGFTPPAQQPEKKNPLWPNMAAAALRGFGRPTPKKDFLTSPSDPFAGIGAALGSYLGRRRDQPRPMDEVLRPDAPDAEYKDIT